MKVKPHYIAHVASNNHGILGNLDYFISHIEKLDLNPAGEFLGARNDNRIILVCKKSHRPTL